MKRATAVLAISGLLFIAWQLTQPGGAGGQQTGGKATWIWFDEGDPSKEAPKGTVSSIKSSILAATNVPVDEGVARHHGRRRVYRFGSTRTLVGIGQGVESRPNRSMSRSSWSAATTSIAVEAVNHSGKAGLLAPGSCILAQRPSQKLAFSTAIAHGRASKMARRTAGKKPTFDDRNWRQAVAGARSHRIMAPWGQLVTWGAGGDDRFTVPAGFRVELAVRQPADDKTFSLINCCFDDKGRLLVSRENGPILLCTGPDKDGLLQTVKAYCDIVKNCQGMCWIGDALWLVGNGPKGTGLYRCRDAKKARQNQAT